MHILYIYKDYPPVIGGIENHLNILAMGMAKRGHRVTVLVNSANRKTTIRLEDGVEVIRSSSLARSSSVPFSLVLPLFLRKLKPDVAHLQFPYPPGEMAQMVFGKSTVTAVTYQSDIVRQRFTGLLYNPFMWQFLKRADLILATSRNYICSSPVLKRIHKRCRVVSLGIDTDRFSKADDSQVDAIRRQTPGPIVLFVGRLRYYKGLQYLIEAMERVEATLLVIGKGPMEGDWKRMALVSVASDRIRFMGDVSADLLLSYYKAADMLVLPSNKRSEALGIVLMEAMAMGTPVISTELGTGTSVVNRHEKTGLVVPPADPSALAGAINALLSNAQKRIRMGQNAQSFIREHYNARNMISQIEQLYHNTLQAKSTMNQPFHRSV